DLFLEERPDIVFHAAALKHVTLVEQNPAEGVLTNVLGTWNVIRAAIAAGAQQFVLVSTDKAVAPTNVMGATKRIAESLLEIAPPS
ncbi:polysaccharide biosynthesis protein, partial [Acinetobacter baumannii]